MLLRNRVTREEYDENGKMLSKPSLFNQPVDYKKMNRFVDDCLMKLPANLSEEAKSEFTTALRREYIQNKDELMRLYRDSQENINAKKDLSTAGFLKSLISSLTSAQLHAISPALGLLLLPLGAAAKSDFIYHAGQPEGGVDLCANLIHCIQGYVSELGQEWNDTLPQLVSYIQKNSNDINSCITQEKLKALVERVYRGPNEMLENCNLTGVTASGGQMAVNMTNVDDITCNLAKNTITDFTQHCSGQTMNAAKWAAVGTLSMAALITFSLVLYKYCANNRAEERNVLINK